MTGGNTSSPQQRLRYPTTPSSSQHRANPTTTTTTLPSSPAIAMTSSSPPSRQQPTSRSTALAAATNPNSEADTCPCPACSNNRSVQHALNIRLANEPPLIRSPLLTDASLAEYNLFYSDVQNHNALVHASVLEGYHKTSISKELATYYNTSAYKARVNNEIVFRSFYRDHGDPKKAIGELMRLLKPVGGSGGVEEHVRIMGGRWNGELISNGDFMRLRAREVMVGYQRRSVSRPGTPTGGGGVVTVMTSVAAPAASVAAPAAAAISPVEKDNGRNTKENTRGDQHISTPPDNTKNKKRKYSTTTTNRKQPSTTTSPIEETPTTTKKPSKRHKQSHTTTPPTPTLSSPRPSHRKPSLIRIPSPKPTPSGTINPRTTLLSKSTQRGEGERAYIKEGLSGVESTLCISPFMGDEEEVMFRVISSDEIRGILIGRSSNYGSYCLLDQSKEEKGKGMGDMWGNDNGVGGLWKVGKIGTGSVGWY